MSLVVNNGEQYTVHEMYILDMAWPSQHGLRSDVSLFYGLFEDIEGWIDIAEVRMWVATTAIESLSSCGHVWGNAPP